MFDWQGITYWNILDHRWVHWIWKKLFCARGWHLFDEVQALEHHDLYCDACGFTVEIYKCYQEDDMILVRKTNERR